VFAASSCARAAKPAEQTESIRFDPSRFTCPAGLDPSRLTGIGCPSLRAHAPFRKPDLLDELLVFVGARDSRSVSRGDRHGISARCLAIDTGRPREEFPDVTALDTELQIVAVAATPGDPTGVAYLWHPGKEVAG
jgi:glucan biosynthesis protein